MIEEGEDIKRINEEIAARFGRIEAGITAAETVVSLLETLIGGIEKEFDVPFVWLTLTDHEKAAKVVAAAQSSNILKNRLSIVSREVLAKLLQDGMKPILANSDLQPFYRLMPPARKYFARSVAIVPLALDGEIIGTWNNGDAVPERYLPDMDSTLLQALAGKISAKLTRLAASKSDASDTPEPGGLHG